MTVTEKHVIANVQCLLLALKHALKQSCHWSIAWSMKLCWLLTTYQSHAASAHWRPSLVSDNHVPVCRFQSMFPGFGALVWFSCSQGWKWMVYITVMSCCANSCCQTSVKLLVSFSSIAHHACARTLSCCDTKLQTSHQTWPPNRPDLSSVHYRLLRVVQDCVYQKQQGTSNIVDELWLLTEKHFINRTDYIS